MAEGFVKEVFEDLEEEFEGDSENKPVYTKKFQGDMLGTSDPYDDVDESEEDQFLEEASQVPQAPEKAQWFSATPKTLAEKKQAKEKAKQKLKQEQAKDQDTGSNPDKGSSKRNPEAKLDGGTDAEDKLAKKDANGSAALDADAASDAQGKGAGQNSDAIPPDARAAAAGSQADEDKVFQKKAKSMSADLDELAKTGKEAKKHKEILRGIRKSLQQPHKLYSASPTASDVLKAAKSGDDERFDKSLQRYGRSADENEDDPQDLSQDPKKLQEVRSNHRKAIRHMVDMGQQYGADPLNGVDPNDLQDIIDHHAAKNPKKQEKLRREASQESENDDVDLTAENEQALNADADDDSSAYPQIDDAAAGNIDEGSLGSEKEGGVEDSSNELENTDQEQEEDVSGESEENGSNEDEESDAKENSDDNYPRIEEAASSEDDPESSGSNTPIERDESFPEPYHDPQNPTDMDYAYDTLKEMANGKKGVPEESDEDYIDDTSEDSDADNDTTASEEQEDDDSDPDAIDVDMGGSKSSDDEESSSEENQPESSEEDEEESTNSDLESDEEESASIMTPINQTNRQRRGL